MPSLNLFKEEIAAALLAVGVERSEARREAELIIEHITGLRLAQQMLAADKSITDDQYCIGVSILQQRQKRVPLQYCLGYAYFMGLKLKVRAGVFIPRGDTETLVEVALNRLRSKTRPQLTEIGTGSGAIAIAILKHLPDAIVTAIDVSAEAVALTEENAILHGVWQRLRLVQADWRSSLPSELDAILSNPPYIPQSERQSLAPEVETYEPELALFGGDPDGLSFYRELSAVGQLHLSGGGFIAVEIGDRQSEDATAIFTEHGWQDVEIVEDLNGLPRVLTAAKAN